MTNLGRVLKSCIFASRWLQAPLYFGLIVAQAVYVYLFMVELSHLIHRIGNLTETDIMLIVLGLLMVTGVWKAIMSSIGAVIGSVELPL